MEQRRTFSSVEDHECGCRGREQPPKPATHFSCRSNWFKMLLWERQKTEHSKGASINCVSPPMRSHMRQVLGLVEIVNTALRDPATAGWLTILHLSFGGNAGKCSLIEDKDSLRQDILGITCSSKSIKQEQKMETGYLLPPEKTVSIWGKQHFSMKAFLGLQQDNPCSCRTY